MFRGEAPTNSKIAALADAIINGKETTSAPSMIDVKPARTKADIIGYDDDEEMPSADESSEDERMVIDDEGSDEKMDYTKSVVHDKVKVLPKTVKGLRDSFNELFCEFTRQGKHEHRNELVFLLDQLLQRGGITREEYKQLNDMISASLPRGDSQVMDSVGGDEAREILKDEKASQDKEDHFDMNDLVNHTVADIIAHDQKELGDLLQEFNEYLDDDDDDTVLKIEELIDIFKEDSYMDNESVLDKIETLLRKLDGSKIPKSTLLRFRIVLKDIEKNRNRVREIFERLTNNNGMEETVLGQLRQEDLLSEEQTDKINAIIQDDKDLHEIADVIKNTKIGRGIHFLPRKIEDLKMSLAKSLEELVDTGHLNVKAKVIALLEELLRRHGISQELYDSIKTDYNI